MYNNYNPYVCQNTSAQVINDTSLVTGNKIDWKQTLISNTKRSRNWTVARPVMVRMQSGIATRQ